MTQKKICHYLSFQSPFYQKGKKKKKVLLRYARFQGILNSSASSDLLQWTTEAWRDPSNTENFSSGWRQGPTPGRMFSLQWQGRNTIQAPKTHSDKSKNVVGRNPEMWGFSEGSAGVHTTPENKGTGWLRGPGKGKPTPECSKLAFSDYHWQWSWKPFQRTWRARKVLDRNSSNKQPRHTRARRQTWQRPLTWQQTWTS